ncbi:hypothetical protein [Bacillus sp. P14.5]|uniref:hypothetical protein n=1 Tax=Bacillus sp. P14.5 TaxID=1983400 RepID=UPI000DEAB784|nr:hypothetical protein [Bacillus sp. P14.5]
MLFVNRLQRGIDQSWTLVNFYKKLQAKANNPVYREYIVQAERDKRKHCELLQYAYYLLTGKYHSLEKQNRDFSTFREGVLMALKSELKEAEYHRELLMESAGRTVYKPIFLIMVDAPANAVRFSCIYNALK